MGRLSTLSGCGTDVDQDRDQWRYGRGGVVICEIPQMPQPCAYGNPENVFLSLFAAAALLSPGPASVAPRGLSLCLFLFPAQQPVAFHGSKSGGGVTWGRLAKLRPQ